MSKYNPAIHHRKSIRLKGYDYSAGGAYFITICTLNRERLFGEIVSNGRGTKFCAPTDAGKIAIQCWYDIPKHYPFVILDEFVIMPNHIHGIIHIQHVGANNYLPINNDNAYDRANNYSPLQINGTSQSIGAIVRGYKIGGDKMVSCLYQYLYNLATELLRTYYQK